jgi:hypothetical protein
MAANESKPDFDKFNKEAEHIICDQFEQFFSSLSARYLELSQNLRETLDQYAKKLSQDEKTKNRSLFLFESIDTFSRLFEEIDENLKAETSEVSESVLDPVFQDFISHFDLEEPDEKPQGPGSEESHESADWKTRLQFQLKDGIQGLLRRFKKSERPENHVLNHFLIKVYIESIEKNQPGINAFFSCIAGMMNEVWKTSNYILLEGDKIAKSKSGEQESPVHVDVDFTEIIQLEEEVNKGLQNLNATLRKDMAERFEELKSANFKPANHDHGDHLKSHTRRHTRRVLQRNLKSTGGIIDNWKRTLMLISDDWLLELEISKLRYYVLLHSLDFGKYVRSKFRKPLDENIAIAENTIKELIDLFERTAGQNDNKLFDELKALRIKVKRNLVLKMVPEVKKIILDSNIPARIDEFEKSTAHQFTQLSKSRSLKKKAIYNEPTDPGDVDRISPASLVSFQMMPDFMDDFPLLKQGFTRHLQEVQNRIEEIPEIIDYSLLSALNYVEEKKDHKEAEKIGLEGVKRAENKIQDIIVLLDDFFNQEITQLDASIEKLTENLSEITDNESALQIKFRIAKAKAIETSKEFRRKILGHFKNFLPEFKQFINQAVKFLRESSIRIRKQFALEDQKHFISTDVSDYLTETEKAIDKLPFIYQRLFKPEPLETFELFTDRPEELEKIKTAYTRWKTGKFAPTVIIGEKGWGKTSLINRFLKLKLTTEEIITFQPDPLMKMEDIYKEILASTKVEDHPEEGEDMAIKRKIIVLDGLERLFEARINGFQVMSSLLHHISESNYRFFWIITCHLHAWQYLDKTLSVSDYFGYHIKLSDFTNEELMKTIERRHSISGYRLMFLPETQKKALISFKKQTDFGDQQLLRTEYFSRMHKIVKGNLAQAFLFWMRSTAHVTEDSVYLEYLSSEIFNFLGSMSDSKLMRLKYIVLQNGLNIENFSSLLRLSPEKSRLYLDQLHDDGILVYKDGIYNINPIIYRQVIEQLYLLNILH